MTNLAKIGCDPGSTNGCFSILDKGQLHNFRMVESFGDMMKILRPYGGAPGDTIVRCSIERIYINPRSRPAINANMQILKTNYERIMAALEANNIPYEIVEAHSWQKFHSLILPKGKGEKGLDYSILQALDKDLKHLQIHLNLEKNVANNVVYEGETKHILESSERFNARKMLCDDFLYFNKNQIQEAIKETEDEIKKFKAKEKTIRKNRYKDYANKIYIKSLIGNDPERIEQLTFQTGVNVSNYFQGALIGSKELSLLFKAVGKKPLTLKECDAVLLLLYQLNK